MVNELKKENEESKKLIAQNESKIEQLKKENENQMNELKAQNESKIEQLKIKNENQMNELKAQNNKLINENDFFKVEIQSLKETIKQSQNQIKEIKDMKSENKNNEYSANKDINNKEDGNMTKTVNDKIKEDNETIYNIQVLKNGTICLGGEKRVYIIKDNLVIETLQGYRKVILPLKNGNLLSSKSTNIYIHLYNDILNYRKISINDYAKQIIELKENNKLLILLENGNLLIMKDETIINTIDNYNNNNKKNIISIIEINDNEIAILLNNEKYNQKEVSAYKYLIFYDLIKYEEIKRLELESKTSINNEEIFYIYDNYLYVSLSDSFFVIDIERRKIQEIKVDYGFSKIYGFENNIFGVSGDAIYKIIKEKNDVKKELLHKDTSKIHCIQPINENKIILSTGKEIKYYNFN